MSKRDEIGLRKLPDGSVAAVIHGGEPVDGCAPIELLVHAAGRTEVLEKARVIGVWSPSISKFAEPSETDAALDSDGQTRWRFWMDGGPWLPESELRRVT